MAHATAVVFKRNNAYAMPKNPKENIVIVFDIPEKRQQERALFRFELRALAFVPLQKSVWIGNGPLPTDFITYMKDHNLLSCVHIFSINKKGTMLATT